MSEHHTDSLEELLRLGGEATPGEWRSPWLPGSKQKCAGVEALGSHYIMLHVDARNDFHPDTVEMWKRNCTYIAYANPERIKRLFAKSDRIIAELRAENERLRSALKELIAARWMVSVDWAPTEKYDAVFFRAQAALAPPADMKRGE